jgi:hypothetical protein
LIDSNHKMASLVAHLMQYYCVREVCKIEFPHPDDKSETPEILGFKKWWMPLTGMIEDWNQEAHLTGEQSCVLHICKDEENKWFAYITHNWKNGPFKIKWDHPAIAYNISIIKRLAGLVGAKYCFLIWEWDEKRIGFFKGEAILCEYDNNYKDEEGRLMRCFVTDCSFRIVWYAYKIEHKLYQSLDSRNIIPIEGYFEGHNKLKNHMGISIDVPEINIDFTDIDKGYDYREGHS